MKLYEYFLYDGRYLTEPESAILYSVADNLKEAREEANDYGSDTVIVKVEIVNNVIIQKKIV
jgi:hypothetical protein